MAYEDEYDMKVDIPLVTKRLSTSTLVYTVCRLLVRDLHGPAQNVPVLAVDFAEEFAIGIVRVNAEADGLINVLSTTCNLSGPLMERPGV